MEQNSHRLSIRADIDTDLNVTISISIIIVIKDNVIGRVAWRGFGEDGILLWFSNYCKGLFQDLFRILSGSKLYFIETLCNSLWVEEFRVILLKFFSF